MDDAGAELMAYINRVRAALMTDSREFLWVTGAVPGDSDKCILAEAMGCSIHLSHDPDWRRQGRLMMSFTFAWMARAVVDAVPLDSRLEHLEVALPPLLVEFSDAFDAGLVEADDRGFVTSWLVPIDHERPDQGFQRYWMPGRRPTEVPVLTA